MDSVLRMRVVGLLVAIGIGQAGLWVAAAAAGEPSEAIEAAAKAAAEARSAADAALAAAQRAESSDAAEEAVQAALDAALAAKAAADASERALAAARDAAASPTSASPASTGSASGSVSMAAAGDAAPYENHVKCEAVDGEKTCEIDLWLTRGFRAFSQCQVCHGLDANGSSFAPSLTQKMREIDRDRFMHVVIEGYKGQVGVMPPWKENPNVMKYIDQLYAYLKARSDGVVPPGKLKRFDR